MESIKMMKKMKNTPLTPLKGGIDDVLQKIIVFIKSKKS